MDVNNSRASSSLSDWIHRTVQGAGALVVIAFGVPGTGKPTVIREVEPRGRLGAEFMADCPEQLRHPRGCSRSSQRRLTRRTSHGGRMADLASKHPEATTLLDRGIRADNAARAAAIEESSSQDIHLPAGVEIDT